MIAVTKIYYYSMVVWHTVVSYIKSYGDRHVSIVPTILGISSWKKLENFRQTQTVCEHITVSKIYWNALIEQLLTLITLMQSIQNSNSTVVLTIIVLIGINVKHNFEHCKWIKPVWTMVDFEAPILHDNYLSSRKY